MENKINGKNYGALAFIPIIIFLGLYVGVGMVLTFLGWENPFSQIPRLFAVLAAISVALIFYDRKTKMSEKVEIYCKGAGGSGVMILAIVLLFAGAFNGAADAIGARESVVNLGLTVIPTQFLVPGIFFISAFVSTCIGSSFATQVAIIPIAISIAQTAELNVGMAGAAAISGAYFGDNLSMISDTTICATKGVGAQMRDKFQMNALIALPAALITMVLYFVLSGDTGAVTNTANLEYSLVKVVPYLVVLVAALSGLDVLVVLLTGTVICALIGIGGGSITFFEFAQSVGTGMDEMLYLAGFAMMVSGLIALVRHYGGITWLIDTLSKKISGRKGCEYVISLISMAIAGSTLNNTVAILITAPIAKEMGEKYRIAPKRLASLLDIFACSALMLVPHDSAMLLVNQYGGVVYNDVIIYAFYPVLLLIFTFITIHFGLLRTPEEKDFIEKQSNEIEVAN